MNVGQRNNFNMFSKLETATIILDCISNIRDNTIPKIMQKTGVSYTAVKNILEELVSSGVISENTVKSRSRGRPVKTYQVVNSLEITYPPRKYDELLSYLISKLNIKYPNLELENIFREIGWQMADEKLSELKNKNIKIEKISDLVSVINSDLDSDNIPHEIVFSGNHIEIKIYTCVFRKVSAEFSPKICQLHENYYSRLLEDSLSLKNKIEHKSNMSKNDNNCTFILTSINSATK